MRKPMFFSLTAAVGALAFLTLAETAQAQWGRRGGRGFSVHTPYFSYSQGHGRGWNRGYGWGGYGGYGHHRHGYYGSPYHYGSSYYYDSPSYVSPDYVMEQPSIRSYQSFYPESANRAQVRVVVPDAQARVWFEDTLTDQQGFERIFVTPDLEQGRAYTYSIRANWMANGQEITRTKKVEFKAGQQVTVAFGGQDDADRPERRADTGYSESRDTYRKDADRPAPRARSEERRRDELRTEEDAQAPPPPAPRDESRKERKELAAGSTHSGKLVRIEKDELTMTDKDGNRHSHQLADDAKVIIDGRDGRVDDLKPGAEIKVTVKDDNMAAKIEVTGSEKELLAPPIP